MRPWFTDGVYHGSWYTFPVHPDPVAYIGDVDYIYISHIHPDHYDQLFKSLFSTKGQKNNLVADRSHNILSRKCTQDGFCIDRSTLEIGRTCIHIQPIRKTHHPLLIHIF